MPEEQLSLNLQFSFSFCDGTYCSNTFTFENTQHMVGMTFNRALAFLVTMQARLAVIIPAPPICLQLNKPQDHRPVLRHMKGNGTCGSEKRPRAETLLTELESFRVAECEKKEMGTANGCVPQEPELGLGIHCLTPEGRIPAVITGGAQKRHPGTFK